MWKLAFYSSDQTEMTYLKRSFDTESEARNYLKIWALRLIRKGARKVQVIEPEKNTAAQTFDLLALLERKPAALSTNSTGGGPR
jgi:hypothetical protein